VYDGAREHPARSVTITASVRKVLLFISSIL
jgi:hypothetical protein